eukprot:9503987-Pyramimonas_sp.AAC.3
MAAGSQVPAAHRGARTATTRPPGQGILLLHLQFAIRRPLDEPRRPLAREASVQPREVRRRGQEYDHGE